MIIFDEAQRVSAQAMSEIRDISDILEIAVVLVGTDRLNAVINRDEQVLYRFLSAYRFSRLGSEELQEMTALWEEHVLQLPEPPNLANPKPRACCSRRHAVISVSSIKSSVKRPFGPCNGGRNVSSCPY
jgi:DNA transposition AAA+ family ATPase